MKRNHFTALIKSAAGISAGLVMTGCNQITVFGMQWTPVAERADRTGVEQITPAPTLEIARAAFNRGNYGIAINHLEQELGEKPTSIAALNGLGASYDRLGRYDVAQRYYFRALDFDAQSSLTLGNIGYSYYLQGRSDEAAQLLSLAVSFDSENKAALGNLHLAQASLEEQKKQVANIRPEQEERGRYEPLTFGLNLDLDLELEEEVERPEVIRDAQKSGSVLQPEIETVTAESLTQAPAKLDGSLRLEVSNGNGVNGMAARVRGVLQELGGSVVRLTNADTFGYGASIVYYRSGHREAAEQLVAALPVQDVALQESEQLAAWVDARLLIGRDLIPFDDQLFTGETLAQNIR